MILSDKIQDIEHDTDAKNLRFVSVYSVPRWRVFFVQTLMTASI